MSSYRKLAVAFRNEVGIYVNPERNRFLPAVLEIAHSLSRGRKPTSCSVLPGENLQTWLRNTFVEITPGCCDFTGEESSIAVDVIDFYQGWGQQAPEAHRIIRAIVLVRRLMRPHKQDSEYRGDFTYQRVNKVTNLKKKAAWLRNKYGSHYDDIHDDYGPLEDFEPMSMHDILKDDESFASAVGASVPTSPVRRVRRISSPPSQDV